MSWLVPLLGILLVGGGYAAAKSYFGWEEKTRSAHEFVTTLDRLQEYDALNRILMQVENGDISQAAHGLDRLLSASIVDLNAQLASADTRTRASVNACFSHMARVRAGYASAPPGSSVRPDGTEIAAQEILTQAAAQIPASK